ncbi:uncharacterized protein LOC134790975 isoform X1 [Cydia splendana]|uniref:uncharacterized protein LOC134790975 isoform X1 n=1 Tax=Cydia splendana TaxID=1100963 RepID=UPI0028F46B15
MSARAASPALIEIAEPDAADCPTLALPPEGNVKHKNYRMLNENLRAYTPTGDIHTSPEKGKLVAKFDVSSSISPPRARILELLRPDDPGRESLEAIVRPVSRRGLTRPLDEDTRRFLQRALLSPSPYGFSADSPEPLHRSAKAPYTTEPTTPEPEEKPSQKKGRSLADELRDAEDETSEKKDIYLEFIKRGGGLKDAVERERLGKLALSVEEDSDSESEDSLTIAARRLDALLEESRGLHKELQDIHQDMQAQCVRAGRCAAAARALDAECRSLRFLDDVLALLRGDVTAASARSWPFALPTRLPGRNYIV